MLLRGLFLVAAFLCANANPAETGSPLQRTSDPFMGDYEGRFTFGPLENMPVFGQIIALGDNAYQLNLMQAPHTRDLHLATLNGIREEDTAVFSGTTLEAHGDMVSVKASVSEGVLTGTLETAEPSFFEIRRIERLSPDLNAPPPEGAIVLFDGESLDEWVHVAPHQRVLNLGEALGGAHCVAYLQSHVWTPEPRTVTAQLGSDDGVKLWVNDQLVHENNVTRNVSPAEDVFPLALDTGWNTLLLKVTQLDGEWGVVMRLVDEAQQAASHVRVALCDLETLPAAPAAMPLLTDTNGYVMEWRVSGPYSQDDTPGDALFDVAFAPETEPGAHWAPLATPAAEPDACRWLLLDDGVMEVRGGGIVSKRRFTDHKVHVEFRTPFMPEARDQDRGNSGVYLQGRYEVQVLDSYGLEGTSRQCGGIYEIASPRVNMCAPPLQWQTFTITFYAPRFDDTGEKVRDAEMTVIHNGVLIHEKQAVPGPTRAFVDPYIREPGPLHLQDHGNPVWYRNIWVLELDDRQ